MDATKDVIFQFADQKLGLPFGTIRRSVEQRIADEATANRARTVAQAIAAVPDAWNGAPSDLGSFVLAAATLATTNPAFAMALGARMEIANAESPAQPKPDGAVIQGCG